MIGTKSRLVLYGSKTLFKDRKGVRKTELVRYFEMHTMDHLTIAIIESWASWTNGQGRAKEMHWVRVLHMLISTGLNEQ